LLILRGPDFVWAKASAEKPNAMINDAKIKVVIRFIFYSFKNLLGLFGKTRPFWGETFCSTLSCLLRRKGFSDGRNFSDDFFSWSSRTG